VGCGDYVDSPRVRGPGLPRALAVTAARATPPEVTLPAERWSDAVLVSSFRPRMIPSVFSHTNRNHIRSTMS